jgi:hypothetical protein
MQRRRIPVLDPFFDRISLLLWPRFKQVFDANLKSVRMSYIPINMQKKIAPIDLSPHYVSRFVNSHAEIIRNDDFALGTDSCLIKCLIKA